MQHVSWHLCRFGIWQLPGIFRGRTSRRFQWPATCSKQRSLAAQGQSKPRGGLASGGGVVLVNITKFWLLWWRYAIYRVAQLTGDSLSLCFLFGCFCFRNASKKMCQKSWTHTIFWLYWVAERQTFCWRKSGVVLGFWGWLLVGMWQGTVLDCTAKSVWKRHEMRHVSPLVIFFHIRIHQIQLRTKDEPQKFDPPARTGGDIGTASIIAMGKALYGQLGGGQSQGYSIHLCFIVHTVHKSA